MKLTGIKDCKNCIHSDVIGTNDNLTIKCISNNYESVRNFRENGRYCAGKCNDYKEGIKKRSGEIKQENALKFILAGHSEFILHSTKTNEDFKFLCERADNKRNQPEPIYFISLVKTSEVIYAGFIKFNRDTKTYEFIQGEKGNLSVNEISIRSLIFVLNKLINKQHVEYLEIYHTGKCGCCKNKLVSDEEVETGFCKLCKTIQKSVNTGNVYVRAKSEMLESIHEFLRNSN